MLDKLPGGGKTVNRIANQPKGQIMKNMKNAFLILLLSLAACSNSSIDSDPNNNKAVSGDMARLDTLRIIGTFRGMFQSNFNIDFENGQSATFDKGKLNDGAEDNNQYMLYNRPVKANVGDTAVVLVDALGNIVGWKTNLTKDRIVANYKANHPGY